ncbi:MAG: hypothetical protein RBR69_03890 [Candidatus Cloacimonadaceae bacterium]|jgi:hypothetical protein|nr:hypothetical protein [Candidatus Cloacimonadota bacterium]MCK9177789.1 hypothetical protein [Candidatus Cloacimonadota bacterium]MDY0127253.1 hypothetical protein [Candidatus Cloacimonadaceae bacterium]
MNKETYTKNPPIAVNLSKFRLKTVWAILLSFILLAYLLYFQLPVLNLRFLSWVPALAFVLLPFWGILKARKTLRYIYIVFLLILILAPFFSSGLFRAKSYRKLIGDIQSSEFSDLVSPIDMAQVPIIDEAFARSLAEKKLGEDFALGSRVHLGNPTIQMVKGKLFWVVPLLHSGFFKWLANRDAGTPGYIMVSATNSQDIAFIREVNGEPLNIRYQRNSFFNKNLKRHLYLNGFTGIAMAGDTFELDDDGEPYWTITVYDHTIGVRAPESLGLATVHACTGKISYYPLIKQEDGSFSDQNIPAWVDRVQPSYFVIPQLDWWGKYVNGFWNTVFGKRDILSTTQGYNVIYGNDGQSYFYTGMSSIGADEGTVGFVLCNTRNKKTSLYLISGATEYAAMRSAQGKVQQFKYYATFPILVNLNDIPTYFMTLKDAAGLVKMYCFVSVRDFSLVGVGETVKSAREDYLMTLASSQIGSIYGELTGRDTFIGHVSRIATDVKDGRSFYYFSLKEKPGLIFVATSNLSSYLPLTTENDLVSIEYLATDETEININEFINSSLEN